MTEYDYSPDAFERFQAKMDGVGKWARQQTVWAPTYTNPFLPPAEGQVSSRPRSSSRKSTSPSPRRHDRPAPARSQTLPAPPAPAPPLGASNARIPTSRTYAFAQGESRAPRSSSPRHHHRSGSQPPAERYPYPVVPAAQPASRTVAMAQMAPPPPGSRQRIVNYSPGQPLVLPPPRRGETYVIVPPPGGGVRAVAADAYGQYPSPARSNSRSHSHSHSHGSASPPKPVKKNTDPPLYKRLLTNLTPNIEWGDSSRSGRSSKRDGGAKRRSASR